MGIDAKKQAAISCLIWCLLALPSACTRQDDTAVIGKLIEKGARLAEQKQLGDLMDLTGQDFYALPGRHDRREVKGILFAAFMHYGRFRIHYPQPAVEIAADGKSASTTIYFFIVSRDQSIPGLKEFYDDPRRWLETVGKKADLYQLKLQLKRDGNDWLVDQARLEGFKGTGF